ncbi:MAG: polysaccharide biosynthesis tyrosine autokinase [Planctomycetaceae bacterium]
MQNQGQDAPWNSLDKMGDDEQGLDIWGFLQRRKSFVILLALVGAGAGYLYFQRQTPRYSSAALLQVIHHNSDKRLETLMAERNLSDSQFVITSRKLLEPCYERHNLGELSLLNGLAPDDAIRRIAGMISAESKAANIVLIACEGSNPSDTAQIANAVAEEFVAHQKESYEDAVTKLQQLLTRAKDELNESLKTLEDEYEAFDNTSPLNFDGQNPHRQQLAGVQSKINTLVIRETEIQAELNALQEAIDRGSPRDALLMLIGKQSEAEARQTFVKAAGPVEDPETAEAVEAVKNARSMFQAMMPLLMEEALLAEELGGGHPKLQALRRRIEMTQDYYERLAGMKPPRPKPSEKNDAEPEPERTRPDFLAIYMNSLKQDMMISAKQREELLALANREETGAKRMRAYEHQRSNYLRRIARETSLLEEVQHQMRATELPTNMGGVTASILTEARHGTLVYPKLSQFLGLGAFLGGFLGLVLGYVVEAADRSFRKPEDIIREFGVPILGHIPYMQEQKLRKIPQPTKIDRTVVALHLPRSRPSEAYRTVRTAVCFSALGNKHRVIQVTSPAAGDGKSTLALNFAVSLAQSGKRTVILESDFRRPRVHKMTGVDNSIGVVDVLRGAAEITDAIHSTELEGLFVMPCGSRPRNPSELITRPEYEQLLETLREKFEYVIIDTPPVLVVTDPCSVAPRTDGVLLCVRLSRQTRDFGRRALEQLRDVGANMTGIVINGVEESDAYGYGNYSYSDYRYRYKDYSYNYRYGEKQNEAYFEEADAEQVSAGS